MKLQHLNQLLETKNKKIKRMAVAVAEDLHVLEAVKEAMQNNLIIPLLIGNKLKITEYAEKINLNINNLEIINEPSPVEASKKAAIMAQQNKVEIIMKGKIATGSLLKCILKREFGLVGKGLLSHVALFESPYYHKILGITDAAMNISPDITGKTAIINNACRVFQNLGIINPKIAVLSAVETVNQKMQATQDAAMLSIMNKRGQISGCIIDGPLALDNAISKVAAKNKGIVSEVAGDADILIVPDINSGNMLYKALNFLGGATSAAIIAGAKVPIVLTSRADSEKCKLLSIALAANME